MKPATTLKTIIPTFALVFGISILFFSPNVSASGYSGISEGGTVHEYLGTYEVSRNNEGEYKKVVYADTGGSKVIKSNEGVELSNWDKEFVYTDQVGSTSFNLDNNGEITEEFKNGNDINKLRYFAYGSTINSIDTSNLVTADTYTGQKEDSEIDLMYYNARYYDPVRGRFIQADSVNDGLNRYMYVSGNPVNANDPSGNKPKENDKELEDYIEYQDYIDTGIWGFAKAFSTWNGNGESSQAACEWTDLCNNSNFTGWSTLANSLFKHAEDAKEVYSAFYDKELFANGEITIQPYYQQEGHKAETRWFSAYDYIPINNSQLTDINIALLITLSAVENPETEGRIFTRSYVGEDAINYSINKRSSSIINTLTYSDNTLANLAVTLRAYQGTYNGGGEFSALSTNRSKPNMEVLGHYNATPEWSRRVYDIYSSLYNFASKNEEYSWLIDNILEY